MSPKLLRFLGVVFLLLNVSNPGVSRSVGSFPVDANPEDGFGYLKILVNMDSVYLVVDGKFLSAELLTDQAVRLPVGEHSFILAHRMSADYRFAATILRDQLVEHQAHLDPSLSPESLLRHSCYPVIRWGANIVVLTEEDSRIYLDSIYLGTGFAKDFLRNGAYTFRTLTPNLESTEETIRPRVNRLTVVELYNGPDKTIQRMLSPVPGFAQFYKNEPIKGAVFFFGTVASISSRILLLGKFKRELNRYEYLLEQAKKATTPAQSSTFRMEAESRLEDARLAERLSEITLAAAAALWIWNLADAFLAPGTDFHKRRTFDPLALTAGRNGISVLIRVSLGNENLW